MQFKHVDKRLNDRERYIDTVKFRTKWIMICAIVLCAVYVLCLVSALASYVYVANLTNGLPGLIGIKVAQDATAQALLTWWSVVWFVYIIVGFFGLGYMIFNCAKLVAAANKMQKKYEAGRIKAWFVILLVFSCVMAVMLIVDLVISAYTYANVQVAGLSWFIAGPCDSIKSWIQDSALAGSFWLALIPIATLVLSIIQFNVARRYVRKVQAAANVKVK